MSWALCLSSAAAINFLTWSSASSLSSAAISLAALLLYTLSLWAALLSSLALVSLLAAASAVAARHFPISTGTIVPTISAKYFFMIL